MRKIQTVARCNYNINMTNDMIYFDIKKILSEQLHLSSTISTILVTKLFPVAI